MAAEGAKSDARARRRSAGAGVAAFPERPQETRAGKTCCFFITIYNNDIFV